MILFITCLTILAISDQVLVAGSETLSVLTETKDTEPPTGLQEKGRLYQQLECVCYGLGTFSSCVSARYQLAMLLLLLDAGQVRERF